MPFMGSDIVKPIDVWRVLADLTQTSYQVYDAYLDINIGVYREALAVVGVGFVRSLNLEVEMEQATRTELIIEIDGAEKSPFVIHASGAGITDKLLPEGHVSTHFVLTINPMWRFETGFKIMTYGNHATATQIGIKGNCDLWLE